MLWFLLLPVSQSKPPSPAHVCTSISLTGAGSIFNTLIMLSEEEIDYNDDALYPSTATHAQPVARETPSLQPQQRRSTSPVAQLQQDDQPAEGNRRQRGNRGGRGRNRGQQGDREATAPPPQPQEREAAPLPQPPAQPLPPAPPVQTQYWTVIDHPPRNVGNRVVAVAPGLSVPPGARITQIVIRYELDDARPARQWGPRQQ